MQHYLGPTVPRQVGKKSVIKSYGVIVFIIIAFFGGWYLGRDKASANQDSGDSVVLNQGLVSENFNGDTDFQLFWDLWGEVKKNYVKQPVDDTTLFYGAMSGMVASLQDPYSEFFDPKTAAAFDEELSGSFSGIGVEVGIKNDALVVIAPLEGSPGDQAGLRPGDIILAIDGADTFTMSLDHAVSLIRGEEGTPVVLTILSKNAEDPRDVTLLRQKIDNVGMRWEFVDGIVHVKFSSFDEETEKSLNKLVREIEEKENIKGIILDMRNNPGGFLDMAIEVASEWVEDGVVVIEKDNNGERREHHARGSARLANYPTVVLINEGSASAAEIVAGALQDYGKATLVGMTTFGKGSVQKYQTLEDGSAFRLTVAEWYTPLERAINNTGISPDIEVDLTVDDYNNDKDPQLDKAFELLKNE